MARDDPGSKSGIRKGCTCDPAENNYGKGVKGISVDTIFVIDLKCPLHGREDDYENDEDELLDRYLLPRV